MTLNWSKRGSSSYMGDYSSITEWLHELQEYGATQPSFDSKFLDSIEAWVKIESLVAAATSFQLVTKWDTSNNFRSYG